jgi:hypothetical protein
VPLTCISGYLLDVVVSLFAGLRPGVGILGTEGVGDPLVRGINLAPGIAVELTGYLISQWRKSRWGSNPEAVRTGCGLVVR